MYTNQPYYIKTNNTQKRLNTMIYYLFPKTFIKSNLICCKTDTDNVDIGRNYSNSLSHYLKQLEEHTYTFFDLEKVCRLSNPFRCLVGGDTNLSLVRYEVIELYNLMNFSWEGLTHLSTSHINKYTIHAIEHIRNKNLNDKHFLIENLSTVAAFKKYSKLSAIDIAFCESATNNEYLNNINLLLQLCVSLCSLKLKGTCIIKIGDTFSSLSLDVITLISHFFEKTFFIKPNVCYIASCEKYIVCKGFCFGANDTLRYKTFLKLYSAIIDCPPDKCIRRVLDLDIPLFVCGKLEEVNSIMGQPRLEKLQSILTSMEYRTVRTSADQDMQICEEWCNKNELKNKITTS